MKFFMSIFVLKSESKTLKFNFKSKGILIIYISDQEEGREDFLQNVPLFFFFRAGVTQFQKQIKKTEK